MPRFLHIALFAIATTLLACQPAPDAAPEYETWANASRSFTSGEVDAYRKWRALDPESEDGRRASQKLSEADARYRRGIELLERGEDGARAELLAGVAIAPMNPALYLRLARLSAERGQELRAAEYYTKWLTAFPAHEDAATVRGELQALDPELAGIFTSPPEPVTPTLTESPAMPSWAVATFGVFVGLALAAALAGLSNWWRRRGVSLGELAKKNPELHPAIAYLVGSLRHELLKHRIGAAGDAIAALTEGHSSREQLDFLRSRLFSGEPLADAWASHLRAFERGLSHRVDLTRDRGFRRAGRAIKRIATLQEASIEKSRSVARLSEAHHELVRFDAELRDLTAGLVRTEVDRALLAEVKTEVLGEYHAGQVELTDFVLDVEEETELEVFRIDLILILKNIVRNAILAVGRGDEPRRVKLDVAIALEPTGEERVLLRVHDTSAETLRADTLLDRRVDRGLGLVAAAVSRYGGSITVEDGDDGFEKAVCVSFFRAFDGA